MANTTGLDFVQALNQASQTPHQSGDGRDLPDGFPLPLSSGQRVIDSSKEEGIDGLNAYDYTAHRAVFLIYRPWHICNRCANQLAAQKVSLPEEDGDITCPHTQLREYTEIQDKALAGKLILGNEQESLLRDGSVIISVKWFEAKINYKRQRALKKKLERSAATQTSEDSDDE